MTLRQDENAFGTLQDGLARQIVKAIRNGLELNGVQGDILRVLTSEIAFGVATVLDAHEEAVYQDQAVVPVVTFQVGDSLVTSGGPSSLHDFMLPLVDHLFEREPPAGEEPAPNFWKD